jgi:hypothetical protein
MALFGERDDATAQPETPVRINEELEKTQWISAAASALATKSIAEFDTGAHRDKFDAFSCVEDYTSAQKCRLAKGCALQKGAMECGAYPEWAGGSSLVRTFSGIPNALAGKRLIIIGDATMKGMVDVLDLAVRKHAKQQWKKKVMDSVSVPSN